MTALDRLLHTYRKEALTTRDKGTAFENLIREWLVVDPVQGERFARVESWAEWARRQGENRSDVGIDLVGTRKDGGLAAIQCKFFDAKQRIQKRHIDSFISASGTHEFAERVIVETTEAPWSRPAEKMLVDQKIPVIRIGLRDLRESRVDWTEFEGTGEVRRAKPKVLRRDQQAALEAVRSGFEKADRGKLIMACGTGKTLTGLRIAEGIAGPGGHVLFLMPSLALVAQSVREWCADAVVPLTSFAVCSDTKVGKRRRRANDVAELEVSDLAFPATTDPEQLAEKVNASDLATMRVVFATYQSISVIENAQKNHALPEFDLILCDEAHRTTGATFPGHDPSHFVKVHDNEVVAGHKRLYMTATPRIYGESAKTKAKENDAILASMDDPEVYGEGLFHSGFAQAVENGILSDYRVIVLAMDEGHVSTSVQSRLSDGDSELVLDDAAKIVGCWKALAKAGLHLGKTDHEAPMRRALAFCSTIKKSKLIRDEFSQVIAEYKADAASDDKAARLRCEMRHVDGTYDARERGGRLDWLKEEDAGSNVCRILTNVRCLTEGVDVPALDAILFLHPRNSQVDVVQAVGRVMRRAPDKRMGYVILPVGIPPGVPPDQALNDNKRYKVVWQILNALRAHDERLDAVINQGGLGQDVGDRITVVDGRIWGDSAELRAITAKVDALPTPGTKPNSDIGGGPGGNGEINGDNGLVDPQPSLFVDDFTRAVMAKLVEKCGTRDYWEDWAKDVAKIAERHITRITSLVEQDGSDAQGFFRDFLREIRDDLNDSVTEKDAVEMLAQHLITRPVFEALFEDDDFVRSNPVSSAMSEVLSVIDEADVGREAQDLEGF